MLNRIKSLFTKPNKDEGVADAQQIAVAAGVLLIEIARADDDVADDEIDVAVNHLKKSFQNNLVEIDDVFTKTIKEKSEDAISLHEFTDLINNEWGKEKKKQVIASPLAGG